MPNPKVLKQDNSQSPKGIRIPIQYATYIFFRIEENVSKLCLPIKYWIRFCVRISNYEYVGDRFHTAFNKNRLFEVSKNAEVHIADFQFGPIVNIRSSSLFVH